MSDIINIFANNLIFYDSVINLITEHVILYWGLSLILLKYKRFEFNISKKVLTIVLFNQCIVGYVLLKSYTILPTLINNTLYTELINYIILYYYLHCIWFYFSHRILHTRFFWYYIHYIHHIYIKTMPYAALYCHPLEHVFMNLMSIFIGPILFPSNMLVTKLWFHICTINTVISHFSSMRETKSSSHDLHHLLYRYNYGTGRFMDIIFGTYMKI